MYCEILADKRKCILGDQLLLGIEGNRTELDYSVSWIWCSRVLSEVWEQRNNIVKVVFTKYWHHKHGSLDVVTRPELGW